MSKKQTICRVLVVGMACCALMATSASAATFDEWLKELNGANGWEEKGKIWQKAGELGADAIPRLAAMIAEAPIQENNEIPSEKKDRAKIAVTALDYIAHHAKRPGAAAECRAVNGELVKLIATNQHEAVRIKALEILGSTGDDATVSALAAVLHDSDPKMRERARWALDRIPGNASVQALQAAIPSASPDFRRDLILTLGDKKAVSAVPLLLNEAESTNPEIRKAAIAAMARIGDRRAVPAVEKAFKNWSGPDQAEATDQYLLLAENLSGDNSAAAARIYREVLQGARSDGARCAALVGLGRTGGDETFNVLLGSLADPSVRVSSSAANALIEMKDKDADTRLIESALSAGPRTKAMLLRVVAARSEKAPATQHLLKEAARDPNAEVRVTALDLLGGLDDPELESTLLEAAEKGSPQIRPVALRSYVRLADTRLSSGKTDQALAMYHRALDLADSDDIRRNALEGVRTIASLESLGRVEKLLKGGSGVEINAALAYVAICAKMGETNKQQAIERLETLVGETGSPGVATAAIRQLREWGVDTAGFAAKAGFITRWWIAGPLPFGGSSGFDASFIDEANVDVKKPIGNGGKTFKWEEVRTDDPQGKVQLHTRLQPNNSVCAYAYTEFDSPRERDVLLMAGSDDGIIVWLNGEKIHANNATRPASVDQDKIKAKLRQGTNRLLLKITQGGGEWEFCVRIGNPQGRPIDITRWGMGGTR